MFDVTKCTIEDIIETEEGRDVYFQYPKDFSLSERFEDEETYEDEYGPVIGMSICLHISDDDTYVSVSPTCRLMKTVLVRMLTGLTFMLMMMLLNI